MAGHEGGMDIRRGDGMLDCAFTWIARNGEVHLTVSIEGAQYGLSSTSIDLTSAEAFELAGGLREAAHRAGPAEAQPPRSVTDADPQKWTASQVLQVLNESKSYGHVLGERD